MKMFLLPILFFSFISTSLYGAEKGLADFCDPEAAEIEILNGAQTKFYFPSDFPTTTNIGKFYPITKLMNSDLVSDPLRIDGISYRIYRFPGLQTFLNCRMEHIKIEIIGKIQSKENEGHDLRESWMVEEAPRLEVEKIISKIISENDLIGVIIVIHNKAIQK